MMGEPHLRSASTQLSGTSLPPRPDPTPLPPRKNASGLPPTYELHLKRLLEQFIDQQAVAGTDGLPGSPVKPRGQASGPLWSQQTAQHLAETIWNDLVIPQTQEGKSGLLSLDWGKWVVEKRRRSTACKADNSESIEGDVTTGLGLGDFGGTSRGARRPSLPPAMLSSVHSSAAATPQRIPSRPTSAASSRGVSKERQSRLSESPVVITKGLSGSPEEQQPDAALRHKKGYLALLRTMKGFAPMQEHNQDEWELLTGTLRAHSLNREIPGAFPQSGFLEGREAISNEALPLTPTAPVSDDSTDFIKPLICLSFQSLPSSSSRASTIHLTRSSSGSSRLRRQLSTLNESVEPKVAFDFVAGRFALPDAEKRDGASTAGIENIRPTSESPLSSSYGSEHDLTSRTHGSEDDAGSTNDREATLKWKDIAKQSRPSILVGEDDDIPRLDAESTRLVGGTIVVRGLMDPAQQRAMENVLKAILFAIPSMLVELDLLDAFSIPREPDLPPKALPKQDFKHIGHPVENTSPIRERHRSPRNFLRDFGRSTKQAFEGVFGARSRRNSTSNSQLTPTEETRSPLGFAVLGLPVSPLVGELIRPQTTASSPERKGFAATYLAELEDLEKQLHSTTPGLKYPIPEILVKIQRSTAAAVGNSPKVKDDGLPTTGNGNLLGLDVNGGASSPARSVVMPSHGTQITGETRSGALALRTGLGSFQDWWRLQSSHAYLSIWPSLAAEPCRPTLIGASSSNGSAFQNFLQQDIDGHSAEDTWTFGNQRVICRRRTLDDQSDTARCDAWIACQECGARTEPAEMSELARTYPGLKLLELIAFATCLAPPSLCEHSDSRKCLTYNFRSSTTLLSLQLQESGVRAVRLPKIEIGPSVPKRRTGKGAGDRFVEELRTPEEWEAERTRVKAEIGSITASPERERLSIALQECRNGQWNQIRFQLAQIHRRVQPTPSHQPASDTAEAKPLDIPVYAQDGVHALPGSDVLVDEDKPCSLIAYTLSSVAYFEQLLDPDATRPKSQSREIAKRKEVVSAAVDDVRSVSLGPTWIVYSKRVKTDENVFSLAQLSRRKVAAVESAMDKSGPPIPLSFASPSASIDLNPEHVAMQKTGSDYRAELVTSLGKGAGVAIPAKAMMMPLPVSAPQSQPWMSRSSSMTSSIVCDAHVQEEANEANEVDDLMGHLGLDSTPSSGDEHDWRSLRDTQPSPLAKAGKGRTIHKYLPEDNLRPAAPGSFRPIISRSVSSAASLPVTPSVSGSQMPDEQLPGVETSQAGNKPTEREDTAWSTVTSTIMNPLATVWKLGAESLPFTAARGSHKTPAPAIPSAFRSTTPSADHALSVRAIQAESKPHLVFTFSLPDVLKLNCTVYFASAFDTLRRRCGIESQFVRSLEETYRWDASGGKSKASFWKTKDGRFVVKELQGRWYGNDLDAVLNLGPRYFEHVASTYRKALVLVKMFGLYGIETHNLKTGKKTAMNLLVMENLFWNQNISRIYDLKGIADRAVPKEKKAASQTQWDGDLLAAIAKDPIFVNPYAHRMLSEALKLDTTFLCANDIMDYSLLLGVDEEQKELVVGLVDAIGSFNYLKFAEHKFKSSTRKGVEGVTVQPPGPYRDRFEMAIRGYFLACPDKWCKMPDELTGTLDIPCLL